MHLPKLTKNKENRLIKKKKKINLVREDVEQLELIASGSQVWEAKSVN